VSDERTVARSAGVVGAATMLSRVLGLVREQVMAGLFGASFATDAFNVAFRIPNLLRDLFAEGAMSSAFVPVFTEYYTRRGADEAWSLGRQLMATLLAVLTVIVIAGWLIAPWVVHLFAHGFEQQPGKIELTVLLTRAMLPFLPAVAVAAVAMGMLNARGVFAVPALAPAMMNIGMVVAGVALIPVVERFGQPAILAMAVGVVLGGVGQFAVQIPSLRRQGFQLRPELPRWHPGVRRVALLMTAPALGLAGTQINLLVSTQIASRLEQGSVSWLWYAFRLMQLPIGVFGMALATSSMPLLSRAAVDGDMAALKRTVSATMRLLIVLTVPAAIWLAVTAVPVIALLYQHGRFNAGDTRQTAGALVMYCVGLPAFAAVGVLTRTFYALGNTRTPVLASLVSVGLNLGLNLLFIGPLSFLGLGHRGLALATSATAFANLIQLTWRLRQRVGPLEGGRMLGTLWRVGLASVLAAGLSALVLRLAGSHLAQSFVVRAIAVMGSLAIASASGLVLMKAVKVDELETLAGLGASLRRRLTGR
jgi:putative peptidoglycan lipid II flippase